MTTNLVSKFKDFMKDLGMWEAFVNTYQACQPSFGPNAKTVDEYLLSCTSSDVFSLVLFSNEGEWNDLSELWKIELSKENASSAVPAKMDDKQLAFTSTISGYKFCTRCYQLKKTFYFNKEKSRNDGLSPYCKDCTNGTVSQGNKKVMNIHTAVYSQNRKAGALFRHAAERSVVCRYRCRHRCADNGYKVRIKVLCGACDLLYQKVVAAEYRVHVPESCREYCAPGIEPSRLIEAADVARTSSGIAYDYHAAELI